MAEIFGISVPDLEPELGTPVEVLCIIKMLRNEDDTKGDCAYRLVARASQIPTWEAYGMAAWIQQMAFDSEIYEDEEEGLDDA